jgi:hypothetical protein
MAVPRSSEKTPGLRVMFALDPDLDPEKLVGLPLPATCPFWYTR